MRIQYADYLLICSTFYLFGRLGTEDSLAEWLEASEQPVHIGFDSLPLEEPENMTNIILQALEITGQRGVINRGWGGLAFIYFSSQWHNQVHHGVAGTTAAGLKAACPTTIVPFFGDQPFWGQRVHAIGVKERAVEIAKAMDGKDGVTGAVNAFHRHFPHNKSEDKPESLPARRGLFSIRRCFGYSSYT
ncbi:unnamed protein product [Prunus armeniaca]